MACNEEARPATSARRDARRRAMLEAAAELFVEKGYGATGLTDVVKRSGGSLATLYGMFGNKAGLFKAIVEDRCLQITAVFEDAEFERRPPREALMAYARRFFTLLMGRDAVMVIRLIIAEGGQFPELAPLFVASGPEPAMARVADFLRRQTGRGALRVENPAQAAEQFCQMVQGIHYLRAVCGLPVALSPEETERHLDGAVSMFLRAYGNS